MFCKNRYTVFISLPVCWLLIFFYVLLFSVSCKNSTYNKTQVYFDTVFNKIASSYNLHFRYTEADMKYLDAAFALVREPGIENMATRYLLKSSYYAGAKDTYNTSLVYADSCISLAQSHPDNKKLAKLNADALNIKGLIYFNVKNYDEAIRNYTLGKIVLTSYVKDSCALYNYYHTMANILYAQQKYLQAAQFFRMKYITATACEKNPFTSYREVQENMDNTGMSYYRAGLTDSAVYYYNATLDYIDQNEKKFPFEAPSNFRIERAVVYRNQADILYQQKDTAGAEKLFLKSIKDTRDLNDISFTRPLHLSLVSLYLDTRQAKKAGEILSEIAITLDSAEISSTAGNFYRLLSDYYIKINQPLAANNSLLRAYNIRDSLEKRDRQFNAVDVRREFENREQKAINEILKKDNEIKNNYLLIAIIGAGMALVIIFLVWYSLKRKSNYVKKLTVLNTEINMRNEDLQHTLHSLEQSHKENNRIVRVVAHDLKNPISAIRTLVYSLLKKEQNPANKEAFELIQSTCVESISLINDLLNNKRTLSDISTELVDIGKLIEQCTELFQIKAEEKRQQFKLQIDHPIVMMNRQKMWRVISNIVNNAIKFSPENTEITIRLEIKNENVLLSVHDNGIGIPADLKDKIFTIDPEKSREGTAGEKSYGLGLSISRKIIEEHEGRLWFESEPGKGSVFYVELPYSIN